MKHKPFTGTCDLCGEAIAPGRTQGDFNRNKGLHLYAKHGQRGKSHSVVYKLKREGKKRNKRTEVPVEPTPSKSTTSICLPSCPLCGARFYAVQTEKE